MTDVKTANDLISDSIDAYFSGDAELSELYLKDAIEKKMTERITECLRDVVRSESVR